MREFENGRSDEMKTMSRSISDVINEKTFFQKLSDAFTATKYVSSGTGMSMKRLRKNSSASTVAFEIMEFTIEETKRLKHSMADVWKTNSLSFFLGSTLFSLSRRADLITGKNYFVPVPVTRRPYSAKENVLSTV